MPDQPVLHVCSLDDRGPPLHACRKAAEAMRRANVEHTRNVFDRNRPFGLFTKGTRPELKALSGQERRPVLELPDGSTVNGSREILDRVKRQRGAAG
jgi:hypothetical protein